MCDRPPASERPAASRTPGSLPIGRLPEESAPDRHATAAVAARPSAMQCVDTASTGLRQAAADVRRLASGLAPAATSPSGSCRAAARLRGCSNDTPHLSV